MSTSAVLPSNENSATPAVPLPLRERRRDWVFVVAFALFATTSFLLDTVNLMGRPDPHSAWFLSRFVYSSGTDSLILVNPRFVQITVGCVSALLFGVFYLVLIYAFVRGRAWIRLPAVFYAEFVSAAKSLAYNLPYPLVGLLLVARVWRDRPFTR